jgi:hypothetical protein
MKGKKTYVATITFEYDGDEPLPFSGKKITHLDDIVQEVKDEVEEFGSQLTVEAAEYIDGELNYKVKG